MTLSGQQCYDLSDETSCQGENCRAYGNPERKARPPANAFGETAFTSRCPGRAPIRERVCAGERPGACGRNPARSPALRVELRSVGSLSSRPVRTSASVAALAEAFEGAERV